MNWVAIQKALYDWVVACTGLSGNGQVVWAGQQAPRPHQPAINLKLAKVDDHGMPWVNTEDNNFTFTTITFSNVNTPPDTFIKAAHGLLTGDGPVRIASTGTYPGNAEADTDYWVIKVDANTIKLATSFQKAMAGTALDLLDAGTGTITLYNTESTVRQGEEINYKSRSLIKCWLTIECYTSTSVGLDMAQAILWRLNSKRLLPTPLAILQAANIGVIEVSRVRALSGTQDAVLFEPRAMVDVLLHLVSEETEEGTIIERVEITNETAETGTTVDGSDFTPSAFDVILT